MYGTRNTTIGTAAYERGMAEERERRIMARQREVENALADLALEAKHYLANGIGPAMLRASIERADALYAGRILTVEA